MATSRGPHDRYWPRDAPVRWGLLVRRLILWAVLIASGLAHLVLAVLYFTAIESAKASGIGAWILAIVWIGLAAFIVWNWWFFRWRIALGPVVGAALLWIMTTRPA
jgi:uncharacterized membrane protein